MDLQAFSICGFCLLGLDIENMSFRDNNKNVPMWIETFL